MKRDGSVPVEQFNVQGLADGVYMVEVIDGVATWQQSAAIILLPSTGTDADVPAGTPVGSLIVKKG